MLDKANSIPEEGKISISRWTEIVHEAKTVREKTKDLDGRDTAEIGRQAAANFIALEAHQALSEIREKKHHDGRTIAEEDSLILAS